MSNLQRKNLVDQKNPTQNSKLPPEDAIAVNGFGQVIAMLRAADDAFKASLISRIALRDPKLARKILAELKNGKY